MKLTGTLGKVISLKFNKFGQDALNFQLNISNVVIKNFISNKIFITNQNTNQDWLENSNSEKFSILSEITIFKDSTIETDFSRFGFRIRMKFVMPRNGNRNSELPKPPDSNFLVPEF